MEFGPRKQLVAAHFLYPVKSASWEVGCRSFSSSSEVSSFDLSRI